MAEEYTPSGSPVTFTVPVYEEVADGPKLAKDLADDVTAQFSIPTRAETLTNKTLTSPTVNGGTVNATTLQVGGVPAVTTTGTQTLTNKTLSAPTINNGVLTGTSLTAPTVGDFSNAQHDHSNATKGGAIPQSSVTGLPAALDSKESVSNVAAHTSATAAHGATGAVVGTTNAQTLTNKTLTSPTVNAATVTGAVTATGSTVTGGTLSGQTIASGTLGSSLTAANNKITGLGTPTDPADASTKAYVDSTTVASAGDTMSGSLAMGGNKVTGLGAPTTDTDAATKGYVDTSVAAVVDAAPGTLDTLNELAAALGDDANFSTSVTNSIATKVAKSGDSVTGDLTFSGGATAKGVPDPLLGSDVANKTYADMKVAKSGDTMTGNLAFSGGAKVTGLPTPSSSGDATPKSYIDQLYGSTASAEASDASAAQSAIDAAGSAGGAAESAAAALASEQATALSESNSASSASASSTSAGQASTSAGQAATSASQSSASQAAASASEIASAASELAASDSESAAAVSESNAAASEGLAQDWAIKTDGAVESGEFSAKYWAGVANTSNSVSANTVDAKGDLIAGASDNTVVRVPVGTNDQVLMADSSTGSGLKWGTVDVSGEIATHNASTTSVHGIADTSLLETTTGAQAKADAAQIAAQGYADTAVSSLVDTAPSTLDTLNELAAALGDDPNFATTVAGQIGAKADSSALTAHESDTTSVHGIANTADLATQTFVSNAINAIDALPSQSGQVGKYLSTDGTVASWANVDAVASDLGSELVTLGTAPTVVVGPGNWQLSTSLIDLSYPWEADRINIRFGPDNGQNFPVAEAYMASLGVGDSITFTDLTTSDTFTITGSIIADFSTINSLWALGSFSSGSNPMPAWEYGPLYIVIPTTTITTDSAATATAAVGLTDGYFVGSTPVVGGTVSGADISLAYAIAGISSGDLIKYWNVPDSLAVKNSVGVSDSLEYDTASGSWRTAAGPLAGTWVSPPEYSSILVQAYGNNTTSYSPSFTFARPFSSPRGEVGIHFLGDAVSTSNSPFCTILTMSYQLQISIDGVNWLASTPSYAQEQAYNSTQNVRQNRFRINDLERWSNFPVSSSIMVRLLVNATGTPAASVGSNYIYIRSLSLMEF